MTASDRPGVHAEGARPDQTPSAVYMVGGLPTAAIPLIRAAQPAPSDLAPESPVRRSWLSRFRLVRVLRGWLR